MTIGVLVMSYGTPNDVDEITAFYTDIRRGRPPSEEEVDELRRRYEAIGGLSPLTQRSLAQVRALERSLEELAPGEFSVFYGTKHATPSIADVVNEIAHRDIDKFVGLVLAPHYSPLSIGDYIEKANAAAKGVGIDATYVDHWHDIPSFIDLLCARVQQALSQFDDPTSVDVIFTAHSLPLIDEQKIVIYREQLEESAALVANKLGLSRYRLGWQSAGQRAGAAMPWLGPDIGVQLVEMANDGSTAIVICPQGFTSDHLEILYDIDIVAMQIADEHGIKLVRTTSLNDDADLARGLAEQVVAHARSTWSS